MNIIKLTVILVMTGLLSNFSVMAQSNINLKSPAADAAAAAAAASDKYHIIAPDLPGFRYSDAPHRTKFTYTFDNLTKTMQSFIDELGLKKFAIYVFDYGALTGYRLALANPDEITQNGNAYIEGLGPDWEPIQKYWEHDTQENRNALRGFVTLEG